MTVELTDRIPQNAAGKHRLVISDLVSPPDGMARADANPVVTTAYPAAYWPTSAGQRRPRPGSVLHACCSRFTCCAARDGGVMALRNFI